VALLDIFGGFPDLLAVCEITREAAAELSQRMGPGFEVAVAPPYRHDDGFQVAVIFRSGMGFSADLPLMSAEELDVSEETRPMIPVRFTRSGQVIRFTACHWTSFDNPRARSARRKQADYVRGDTYEFLQPKTSSTPSDRHTIILGDLNEEPTSPLFEEHLEASRDHSSGRQATHWRDHNPRRPRLYNASWRFLGEQVAYSGGAPTPDLAGTFFNTDLGWRTFDHLIVSGGLLNVPPPYLDEGSTRVVATPSMRSAKGTIEPFDPTHNTGISDHLPIVGRIILSEGGK
jgi:endonuclease/exonuclease/phosphatase family metal-dependent hydrolase